MPHDTRCIPYLGRRYPWSDDVHTVRYTLERVRASIAFIHRRRANVDWTASLLTFQRQGERIAAGLESLLVGFTAYGGSRPPQHRAVCQHVCRANAWLERLTLRVSSPLIQQSPQSPFTGNRATSNPKFEESACNIEE